MHMKRYREWRRARFLKQRHVELLDSGEGMISQFEKGMRRI